MENAATKSTWSVWASGLFVSIVFAMLFVLAVLRLRGHVHGETFMHAGGLTDSLLALTTPAAMMARLNQMRLALKAKEA
jgi:hypothetical protein